MGAGGWRSRTTVPLPGLRSGRQRPTRDYPGLLACLLVPGGTLAGLPGIAKAAYLFPSSRRLAAFHLHAKLPRHPSWTTDGNDSAVWIVISHIPTCA